MNVIWITADTFRKDHLGAYGNAEIRTPALDALAGKSMRFDRHYAASFPTMPTRADHATGRWTLSFLPWGPLPEDLPTLAERATEAGIHTAAVVDTPFYIRTAGSRRSIRFSPRRDLRPGFLWWDTTSRATLLPGGGRSPTALSLRR